MANVQRKLQKKRDARKWRTRRIIASTAKLPRLSVFRSAKHFYMQIIDDKAGKTLCGANDLQIKDAKGKKPLEVAAAVGKLIAENAKAKKVESVVFDRGSYKYHGRVKAGADAAREGGLKF